MASEARTGTLTLETSHSSDDISALLAIPAQLDKAMLGATIDAADDLMHAIKARIPRSNDPAREDKHAQDTWRQRIVPYSNGAMVVLFTEDAIAYWYWSGTKAHPIVARFAKALRFMWRGELWFRHSVGHPGTKPHPYVEEAGAATAPLARERYEDAVSRVLGNW